jgi:hypothetical protein
VQRLQAYFSQAMIAHYPQLKERMALYRIGKFTLWARIKRKTGLVLQAGLELKKSADCFREFTMEFSAKEISGKEIPE